jgi:hypothetical protein
MFKTMIFSFLAGVILSQPIQDWTSDGVADTSRRLSAVLHIDAYDRIAAALGTVLQK